MQNDECRMMNEEGEGKIHSTSASAFCILHSSFIISSRVGMLPAMSADPVENSVRQSAALPYRWREGALEVLLVTRRNHADEWIIPKGQLEPGHTEAESAAVEAAEEAGVAGRIDEACAGTYRYRKW